jgi:transcriptional regulator with XRE-family HTH domain
MATPLKLARERREMSQAQLAKAMGVTPPHITKIESGVFQASPALAKKLAAFFGAPLTRDQILFPEEYTDVHSPTPVRPQRARQEQAA